MAEIGYVEALNQALKEEMRRDDGVVIWGEDMVSMNGVHGQTRDIYDEFGGDRIKDTPICEQAIAGMTIGAAQRGMRPIGVFMNWGFGLCAFDGVFLQLGCKGRNWPVVLYGVIAGPREDNEHGMSPEALLIHAPFLKVVMPSTPYDAKGLLKAAIRDDNPVLFIEHKVMYSSVYGPVPDDDYIIPLGVADIKREGADATIVAYSRMLHFALAAADELAKDGVNVEVIDPRTLNPLDIECIAKSVRKTGRLITVSEGYPRCGVGGEIARQVMEYKFDDGSVGFDYLDAPPALLSGKDCPVPMSEPLEAACVPTVEDVVAAVRAIV